MIISSVNKGNFLSSSLYAFSFSCFISKDFPEKAMAPHSSTLAWKIPWTEEPGRLQSMGSLRVGHDFHFSLSCIGEGNGNPLQCSCLENPRDGGAWWAAVYGVAQLDTTEATVKQQQQGLPVWYWKRMVTEDILAYI